MVTGQLGLLRATRKDSYGGRRGLPLCGAKLRPLIKLILTVGEDNQKRHLFENSGRDFLD